MRDLLPSPRNTVSGLIGLATVLLVWQLVTMFNLVPQIFFPSPERTFNALYRGFTAGNLTNDLRATVLNMLQGWLLASLIAIVLGSMIGISETARAYLQPTLEFLRPLPASATIPVFIVLIGLNQTMVLSVIAFGCVWPTLLATVHGFAAVDPRLREAVRTLHVTNLAFIWKVGLPNAVPDIIAGMRLSLAVALILTVVCEMLTGQDGLGTTILLAARSFRTPNLFAGIVLLGFIGLVSNHALRLVELKILAWRQ